MIGRGEMDLYSQNVKEATIGVKYNNKKVGLTSSFDIAKLDYKAALAYSVRPCFSSHS